jgi:5-(carboxyamino)imidazole ribonucleotide mutase
MAYDVVIILGSESDLKKVEGSKMLQVLRDVGMTWVLSVISAHRNSDVLASYVNQCNIAGTQVFIGVAGMAAALPGAIAAHVQGHKIVLGVALSSPVLDGLDALLSQVRMPPGRPVGVCGIDEPGLYNAALMACQIVALTDQEVRERFVQYMAAKNKPVKIGLLASDKKEGGA